MIEFLKKAYWQPHKKTMPYHTNCRNKYKSRTARNTFYQQPHSHSQNYPQKPQYP